MTDLSYFSASRPLVMAGCGNMGKALLAGWLKGGLPEDAVCIVDPVLAESPDPSLGAVTVFASGSDIPAGTTPGMVVLAVKPQIMDKVAPDYIDMVRAGGSTVLSIAAGIGMEAFEGWFGTDTLIVRVMPNTPSAVGFGMSLLLANGQVAEDIKNLSQLMLEAVGEAIWVRDEAQIDALVGVTGSGPAYVFLLIECIAAAAEKTGLSPEQARAAARQTVLGSAQLASQQSDVEPAELRRRVTSPGGVTQAALEVLMAEGRGLPDLFPEAMEAGERRNAELSGKA